MEGGNIPHVKEEEPTSSSLPLTGRRGWSNSVHDRAQAELSSHEETLSYEARLPGDSHIIKCIFIGLHRSHYIMLPMMKLL